MNEYVSILGSSLILIGFLFKNIKTVRIINAFGCLVFVVYGTLLMIDVGFPNGLSILVMNFLVMNIHIIYLIRIRKERRRKESDTFKNRKTSEDG